MRFPAEYTPRISFLPDAPLFYPERCGAILPSFATAQILSKTPELEQLEVLRLCKPLVHDGPHTQVFFRGPFSKKIRFPRERMAVIVEDSEFNLTLFAEEQAWMKEVKAQILRCGALDEMIREANQGKALHAFSIM